MCQATAKRMRDSLTEPRGARATWPFGPKFRRFAAAGLFAVRAMPTKGLMGVDVGVTWPGLGAWPLSVA